MKIQAIQNYNSTNKISKSRSNSINNSSINIDSFQKSKNNSEPSFGELGAGPAHYANIVAEAYERGHWNIDAHTILNAGKERLRDLAESFHLIAAKEGQIPSGVCDATKKHWFWGEEIDWDTMSRAKQKFAEEINKVLEIKDNLEAKIDAKTATKVEIAEFLRLEQKARNCHKDYHTKGGDI